MAKLNFWKRTFSWLLPRKVASGFVFTGNEGASFNASFSIMDTDIARSAIRAIARSVGKLDVAHIFNAQSGVYQKNPEPSIREMLFRPNPYMTMSDLLSKMTFHLQQFNNAYALIIRDANDNPVELYPIPASNVVMAESGGRTYLKFSYYNSKTLTVRYDDIIHIRQDFNGDEFFGDGHGKTITDLISTVKAVDVGIGKAVKNASFLRWLMKFNHTLNPDDEAASIKAFKDNYMSIDSNNDFGIAPTNPKYELTPVKNENIYMPRADIIKEHRDRIYAYFGVGEAIVNNTYTEDEWNAFYESVIEPIAKLFAAEMTYKFFTNKRRAVGNFILLNTISLQYASMSTKLNLVQMVDRGALTPNEWRRIMNLDPVDGGDVPIRRLDTAVVQPVDLNKTPTEKEETEKEQSENDNKG